MARELPIIVQQIRIFILQ